MTPTQIAAKPADKRTPIEQAILDIDSHKSIVGTDPKIALDYAIWNLSTLLKYEREQIERAFISGSKRGYITGSNHAVGVKGKNDKTAMQDVKDYFTQTYGE